MEEEKNWGQKLMAEDAEDNPPGINLRFLAQGMIKIAHEDLPAGFFEWSLEDQLGWAYEYWSHMDDDQLVGGVAYLTPIEDAIIDMVEVDGWYKDEEYPVLASTKTWAAFWAGGRDEKLRTPEEVTKLENLMDAAPALLEALKRLTEDIRMFFDHPTNSWDDNTEGRFGYAFRAIKKAEEGPQPEDKGSLGNLEKCEDCIHGETQDDGGQATCTCPDSTEGIYAIRDILFRTGTCPFYAWKH